MLSTCLYFLLIKVYTLFIETICQQTEIVFLILYIFFTLFMSKLLNWMEKKFISIFFFSILMPFFVWRFSCPKQIKHFSNHFIYLMTFLINISRERSLEIHQTRLSDELDVNHCLLHPGVQLRPRWNPGNSPDHGPIRLVQDTVPLLHGHHYERRSYHSLSRLRHHNSHDKDIRREEAHVMGRVFDNHDGVSLPDALGSRFS